MTDELRAKFETAFPHLDFSADKYGNYYSQRTLDHLYGYQAGHASRDAEVAALRKDAERYRWLRNKSYDQWTHPICVSQERTELGMRYVGPLINDGLDQAIDAAMAKESGE